MKRQAGSLSLASAAERRSDSSAKRGGDDSQTGAAGCVFLDAIQGVGDVLERVAAGAAEPVEELADAVDQAGAIGRGEQDGFGIPGSKAPGAVAVGGRGVFLEHGVGVDSGEAEGVHAGAAGRVRGRHGSRGALPDSA